MFLYDLKVNHLSEPKGIDLSSPVFSFCCGGNTAEKLVSSRIIISENSDMSRPVYDSGERTDISPLGFVPDVRLSGGRKYYWQVETKNSREEKALAVSFFEGGRENEKWDLPFVSSCDEKIRSAAFYRRFDCRGVYSATLYITGLGVYEVYINGKKVGDEYFAPFYNDYRYVLQYQTYDCTEYIKEGINEITVLLGSGWYGGRYPAGKNGDGMFGDERKFSAELFLNGSAGTKRVITDKEWKETESPVVFSEIYDGEIYDARKSLFNDDGSLCERARKTALNVKKVEAPCCRIIPRISPSICERESFYPSLIRTPNGELVLDFGQEITGWVEFSCEPSEGEEVKLSYGEALQEGCFYRENLRTAKAEYRYISDGKKRKIRPHFTFYGFRYVKTEGIPDIENRLNDFVAKALYSEIPRRGFIRTSDGRWNKFIENTLWGERGNFLDIPSDCPQRDERFGWTGDAEIFSETAFYHTDCTSFFAKYLYDMKEEQRRYGGACPFVVPDCFFAYEEKREGIKDKTDISVMINRVAAAWGDAAVIIPWNTYRFSGDVYLLEKNYENMRLWTDFLYNADEKIGGGKRLWNFGFQFGDWLALDNRENAAAGDKRGATDEGYIASAYYYNAALTTAKAARVLGKTFEAEKYEKLAEEILTAIKEEFVTLEGRLTTETQTSYALAAIFGFLNKKQAGEGLMRKLEENGFKLNTGFIGTAYLLDALTLTGNAEYAYKLMSEDDYPSWLYEVRCGATTVWERWNSMTEDGKIGDVEMNSLNHYAYGSAAAWIYKTVCGINCKEGFEGFRKAEIRPIPNYRLGSVFGEYRSSYGIYRCGYELSSAGARFEITVPCLGEAEFFVPEGYDALCDNGKRSEERVITLEGGKHLIKCIKKTAPCDAEKN